MLKLTHVFLLRIRHKKSLSWAFVHSLNAENLQLAEKNGRNVIDLSSSLEIRFCLRSSIAAQAFHQ